jgi:hypothetical protein
MINLKEEINYTMEKMELIKVTAIRCSQQGDIVGQTIPSKLQLNYNLSGQ